MFDSKEKYTAGVQFYEGEPAICGDKIMWIDDVIIEWKDYPFIGRSNFRKAFDSTIEILEDKYPQYKSFIGLY